MSWIEDLCFGAYIVVGLAIFFWIAYKMTKAIINTEKKIWRWMNEEPDTGKTSRKKETIYRGGHVRAEEPYHRSIQWGKYTITVGDYSFMQELNFPSQGMLVQKEDFTLFRSLSSVKRLSDDEMIALAKECLNGMYEVAIAWKDSYEIVCGTKNHLRQSYGLNFNGLVISDGNLMTRSLVHVFHHHCRNISRERMIEFMERNINRNEDGFLVYEEKWVIMSFNEVLMREIFKVPRDMLVVLSPFKNMTYMFDVPFKIRTREELIKIALESMALHSEVLVIIQRNGTSLTLMKSYIAEMIGDMKENSIGDILQIEKDGETKIVPVEWRAWTEEELDRLMEKYG